jgi:hypothetical protein
MCSKANVHNHRPGPDRMHMRNNNVQPGSSLRGGYLLF